MHIINAFCIYHFEEICYIYICINILSGENPLFSNRELTMPSYSKHKNLDTSSTWSKQKSLKYLSISPFLCDIKLIRLSISNDHIGL